MLEASEKWDDRRKLDLTRCMRASRRCGAARPPPPRDWQRERRCRWHGRCWIDWPPCEGEAPPEDSLSPTLQRRESELMERRRASELGATRPSKRQVFAPVAGGEEDASPCAVARGDARVAGAAPAQAPRAVGAPAAGAAQ